MKQLTILLLILCSLSMFGQGVMGPYDKVITSIVKIPVATAPSPNTQLLYSVGGHLYWAGVQLDIGSSSMVYPAVGIPLSTGTAWVSPSIVNNSDNWNTAFGWGDHTVANVGTGTGLIYRNKTANLINLKSIKAGTGIILTNGTDDITVGVTSSYQPLNLVGAGINVVTGTYPNLFVTGTEVDGSVSNEIQHLSFNSSSGYLGITQGTGVTIPVFSSVNTNKGLVPGNTAYGIEYFLNATGVWTKPEAAGYFVDPTTIVGDMIYRINVMGEPAIARLPAGTSGQVLATSAGLIPTWTDFTPTQWTTTLAGDIHNNNDGNVGIGVTNPATSFGLNGSLSMLSVTVDHTMINDAGIVNLVANIIYDDVVDCWDTWTHFQGPQIVGGSEGQIINIKSVGTGRLFLRNDTPEGDITPAFIMSGGDNITIQFTGTKWLEIGRTDIDPIPTFQGDLWILNGSDIYYTAGRVSIGTPAPATGEYLSVLGNTRFNGIVAIGPYEAGYAFPVTAGLDGQVLSSIGEGGIMQWVDLPPANPMTTKGDMVYWNSTVGGVPTRLPIGSANQVLTSVSGLPTWQNPAAGFTNPMTTVGDIMIMKQDPDVAYPPEAPVAGALARGTSGQFLSMGANRIPEWVALPVDATHNPLTIASIDYGISVDGSQVLSMTPASRTLPGYIGAFNFRHFDNKVRLKGTFPTDGIPRRDSDTTLIASSLTDDGTTVTGTNITYSGTLKLSGTLSDDHSYNGTISAFINNSGVTLNFGDIVYINGENSVCLALASTMNGVPACGMVMQTGVVNGANVLVLTNGFVRDASFDIDTPGQVVYLGEGVLTKTPPTTTGYTVQILGIAKSTGSKRVMFNPQLVTITLK